MTDKITQELLNLLNARGVFPGLHNSMLYQQAAVQQTAGQQSHQQMFANQQSYNPSNSASWSVFFETRQPAPAFYACEGLRRLSAAIRHFPDPSVSNTFGWRHWHIQPLTGLLVSPYRHTIWHTPELRCADYADNDSIRDVEGIHALLVPHDWINCPPSEHVHQLTAGKHITIPVISGIVERFGKYVLGSKGWRAEWVIVRKLAAPSRATEAILKLAYPDVEIILQPPEPSNGHR